MQNKICDAFKNHPLICYLIIHFLVWSFLPLLRNGAPMDSMEAVWWGKYCTFGTNKHPPLSGFPAYAYYLLFGRSVKAVYSLSQTCIVVGFAYIYKLAGLMLDEKRALLAVMLLEGVVFYGLCSPEYNVNVLSLALWPLTAYYFCLAVLKNRLSPWLLAGFAAALNVLNKYVSGLQLLGIVLYLFLTENGRHLLRSYKPYAALALFFLLVAPHFYWLWQHDFFVMEYYASRSGADKTVNAFGADGLLNHFLYPAEFLASVAFYALGALVIFFGFSYKSLKKNTPALKERQLLFFLGIFPLLFILAYSFVSGCFVKSMWGYPILYLLGIILFKLFDFNLTSARFVNMQKAVYFLMLLYASVYAAIVFFTNSPKYNLDGKAFAANYTHLWRNHMGRPLKYVIGDAWLPSIMALESSDSPMPVMWGETRRNPWINEAEFKRSGALVLAESLKEYHAFTENYKAKVSPPHLVVLEFENILGKVRKKKFYYGFYKGEQ